MNLTLEDVALLKQLKAAGEGGRTIRAYNVRLALDRLAKGGYVIGSPDRHRPGPLSDHRAGTRGSGRTRLIWLAPPSIVPPTERSGEHAPNNCRERGDLIRRKRCNLYNQFISRGLGRGTLRCLQKESGRFMDTAGYPHCGGCPYSTRE